MFTFTRFLKNLGKVLLIIGVTAGTMFLLFTILATVSTFIGYVILVGLVAIIFAAMITASEDG